jgi:outer membrane lipoprotein-sorting protein
MSAPARRVAGHLAFATATSVVLIWLTGSTGAQVTDTETAITQARNAMGSMQSLQADVEGTVGPDRFTGTLSLKRPNLAFVDVKGSDGLGNFQVTSNGTEVLMYFPEGNQFSRARPGPDGRQITAFVIASVRHFFNPAMLAQVGDTAVARLGPDATLDGEIYQVIEVSDAKTSRMSRYFRSRRDGLVHRIEYQRPGENGGRREDYVQLRNIRANADLPNSLFAWTLPEGATPLQMPGGVDLNPKPPAP